MAKDLKLNRLSGDILPLKDLFKKDYTTWAMKFTSRFVVQLPELTQGGGRGTFFIKSPGDYEGLLDRLKTRIWRGKRIHGAAIRPYIEGYPASLALCITRHGTLISRLQRQLVDLIGVTIEPCAVLTE